MDVEKPNCIGCHHIHPDNGNCTAVGGFCTAVPAANCPLIPELRAENEKMRAELEQVKQERDAAQRLLAEHTGVVGMEKVTTCAEKKAWLRRYQGSLRQEKELAEEVEQLEVEI